jgi:hypothetical protein
VHLIHRTAIDFLENHRQAFFRGSNWRLPANIALIRGKLGLMRIFQNTLRRSYYVVGFVSMDDYVLSVVRSLSIIDGSEAVEETEGTAKDAAIELVAYTFHFINDADEGE